MTLHDAMLSEEGLREAAENRLHYCGLLMDSIYINTLSLPPWFFE